MLTDSSTCTFLSPSIRNAMPDFGSEVMAEALAQRALVKPVYTIPIIPLSSTNQYRHQDHLDMKDYKKVRPYTFATHCLAAYVRNSIKNAFHPLLILKSLCWNRMSAEVCGIHTLILK